jgi:hypothetical protein
MTPPAEMSGSQPLATIEIELRHGVPTVDVRVAGEPLRLFLDLGGHRAIALTASELSRVKVKPLEATDRFRNSAGQVLTSRRFIAQDVVLGSLPLGDLEGSESVFGDSVPPDRNGYIGMPVLGRYLLVLDYPAKQLRMYRTGDKLALERECGPSTFPVSLENGIATTRGNTEFGDLVFLWDTGTTHNFIRRSSVPQATGRRIDDGSPVMTVQKLVLGERDYGPQEFRLIQFQAPAVDAYLGAGLLGTRRVCLDIPQGKGGSG